MDPIIHPSAPDVLLWLGTVTKLKGESNVMQWYVDLTNVVPIIDRDIWDIMNGTYGIPDGGPVQEHDADEIIAGACAQYGKKKRKSLPK
ncbi:hypothetical protein N7528_006749 [Penicillium herquei]|nr:hypothetical protein N7528_006749 [Penicillium herquei]